MRQIVIAGNWKMYKLRGEARKLASDVKAGFSTIDSPVRVVLCPPFTSLVEVAAVVAGTKILLGAQNMHWEEKGAYTGEISPLMLKDAGCTHVIIGHSERRRYFGETDESVNRKVRAALAAGLRPIVCVGETERQREEGKTKTVVVEQVQKGLASLTAERMAEVTIAYEPVWAIGTGKNATPEQAQQVHALIRELTAEIFGPSTASSLSVLYGGSVKPDNAGELLDEPDIDGALVGGASLDADSFGKIVRAGIASAPKKKSKS